MSSHDAKFAFLESMLSLDTLAAGSIEILQSMQRNNAFTFAPEEMVAAALAGLEVTISLQQAAIKELAEHSMEIEDHLDTILAKLQK